MWVTRREDLVMSAFLVALWGVGQRQYHHNLHHGMRRDVGLLEALLLVARQGVEEL